MKVLISEKQYKLILKEQEEFYDKIFELSKYDMDLAKELADGQGIDYDNVLKYVVTNICDELIPGLFKRISIGREFRVYIMMKGEETYKYNYIISKIREEIPTQYRNIKLIFEKEFNAEVDYDGDYVTLTKKLDNGTIFELTGILNSFHSGRAMEYEFEPEYYSNDEYYNENWELLDDFILNHAPPLYDRFYDEEDEDE